MKPLDCAWASYGDDAIVLLLVIASCGACTGGRIAVVVWLGGGRDPGHLHDVDAWTKACIA